MSWKDEDEVTTTYGTIHQAQQENYIRGFYDGLDKRLTNNTDYTDGFKAGQRNEREYLLSFVEDHEGIPITVQDIVNEINGRYTQEMNQLLKGMGL
jgi:phage terminase large subunit-like protein